MSLSVVIKLPRDASIHTDRRTKITIFYVFVSLSLNFDLDLQRLKDDVDVQKLHVNKNILTVVPAHKFNYSSVSYCYVADLTSKSCLRCRHTACDATLYN